MKKFLVALLFPVSVQAAPFLTADAWPTTTVGIPDSVSVSVSGGTPIACTLPTVTQGIVMLCDLKDVGAGVHQLVVTATKAPTCTSVPNVSGTCTTWTPWVSSPFTYTATSTATKNATNIKVNVQ